MSSQMDDEPELRHADFIPWLTVTLDTFMYSGGPRHCLGATFSLTSLWLLPVQVLAHFSCSPSSVAADQAACYMLTCGVYRYVAQTLSATTMLITIEAFCRNTMFLSKRMEVWCATSIGDVTALGIGSSGYAWRYQI